MDQIELPLHRAGIEKVRVGGGVHVAGRAFVRNLGGQLVLGLCDLPVVIRGQTLLDALPPELALGAVPDAGANVRALGLGDLGGVLVNLDEALLLLMQINLNCILLKNQNRFLHLPSLKQSRIFFRFPKHIVCEKEN